MCTKVNQSLPRYFKIIFATFLYCVSTVPVSSQNTTSIANGATIRALFTSPSEKNVSEQQKAFNLSSSGDSYKFMELRKTIGALNSMIAATGDEYWIQQQKTIINNILLTARVSSTIPGNQSFNDKYKGWISLTTNKSVQNEVPLYEGYSFFYIMQFLYQISNTPWLSHSDSNHIWWNNTLAFVEKNVWTKWYERSFIAYRNHFRYFLRGRTHMGSHWAGIAMYLNSLSTNSEIKSQTAEMVQQYDTLLKRNFKYLRGGYVWNSTYDDVVGTYASASPKSSIQDVSHGNHVVSYIIAAYRFGNKDWTPEDIKRLSVTLGQNIYDAENNRFHDNVDGSDSRVRPGWGNFVSDGWVLLAAYDGKVKEIFQRFENTGMLKKYNQQFQFLVNLYQTPPVTR